MADDPLSFSAFLDAWELFADSVIAGAVAGVVLGVLGVYVVLRRMVFLSAALSQSAGLGVTLAFYLQIHLGVSAALASPTLGSVVVTLLAVLALAGSRERRGGRDGLLGVVFLLGAAGTLIVGTRIVQELQDVQALLFGTAVAVLPEDLQGLLIVCGAVALVHLWGWRGFVAVVTDAEGARVRGLPVRALEVVLLVTIALTIASCTRVLGALPVFAFSVLPAMFAVRVVGNVPRAMWVAGLVGGVCGALGYVLAFMWELPVGASQATVGVALVAAALLWNGLVRGSRAAILRWRSGHGDTPSGRAAGS